jgi:hypothetical protein
VVRIFYFLLIPCKSKRNQKEIKKKLKTNQKQITRNFIYVVISKERDLQKNQQMKGEKYGKRKIK